VPVGVPATAELTVRGNVAPVVPRNVEYARDDAPEAFVFSFVKKPVVAGDGMDVSDFVDVEGIGATMNLESDRFFSPSRR
jgi:hypothetical protein